MQEGEGGGVDLPFGLSADFFWVVFIGPNMEIPCSTRNMEFPCKAQTALFNMEMPCGFNRSQHGNSMLYISEHGDPLAIFHGGPVKTFNMESMLSVFHGISMLTAPAWKFHDSRYHGIPC